MTRKGFAAAMASFAATALATLGSACSSFDVAPDGPDMPDAADATTRDSSPVDATPPVDSSPPPSGPKRMFVSSGEFTGDLVSAARSAALYKGGDGLEAADALCAREGTLLGAGPWKAWISTAGPTGVSAIARFSHPNEPRFDAKGTRLLDRLGADLKALVPDIDGKGTVATRAWTDTTAAGYTVGDFEGQPADCAGWTVGPGGRRGASGNPSDVARWSEAFYGELCTTLSRLYCIED